ncbi:MAG: hypothetical protein RL011_957 [Pseudomonadota bacterium]
MSSLVEQVAHPAHSNSHSHSHAWITRFAPSPTGYLHLGHVASLIFVNSVAKALKAKVILRMEDHDQGRCRPAFERTTFEDLDWLGYRFDNPDFNHQMPSSYRQSDNIDEYARALAELSKAGLVYGCNCSRQAIIKRTGESSSEELRYDGHCRDLGLPLDDPNLGLRVRFSDSSETFIDANLGPQSQVPINQCGDLLLRDRHNNYTYNFAVVVDDLRHGVNLVVRGSDVLHATGRQIYLARLLGQKNHATYYHHRLLVDASGAKLSKRTFADAIAKRRANGEHPAQILGEAAYAAQLISEPHQTSWDELADSFTLPDALKEYSHG